MTRSTEGVLAAASSMYLVTLAKLADLSAPAFNCNNATLRDLDSGDFNTGDVIWETKGGDFVGELTII